MRISRPPLFYARTPQRCYARRTVHSNDKAQQEVIVGIDEAGYGPRIGPLCIGACAVRRPPESEAPDLWRLLRPAVCRKASSRGDRRLVVADSKEVVERGRGGLIDLSRLERTVLSFLRMQSDAWRTDEDVFASLGATLADSPWYDGGQVSTPVDASPQDILVATNALRVAMHRAGVSLEFLRCEMCSEQHLNAARERTGSKALVNWEFITRHLRRAWELASSIETRVHIDRQGGRTRYAMLLRETFPGCEIARLEHSKAVSRYAVSDGGRRMAIEVRVRAEQSCFATALASMTAKYIREIAMARLNEYWSRRAPGIRPTAGYGADANRWLGEVAHLLSDGERRMLVRES